MPKRTKGTPERDEPAKVECVDPAYIFNGPSLAPLRNALLSLETGFKAFQERESQAKNVTVKPSF